MTITPEELEALLAYIDSLEAQVAEQAEQVDFLLRERILLTEGRDVLERTTSTETVRDKLGPGLMYGNAGQVCVANPALAGRPYSGSSRWRPD